MNKLVKLFLVIPVIFALTACGSTTVIKETDIIETPVIHPNLPTQIDYRPVEWKIEKKTTENQYVLDEKNYRNLNHNILEMNRYILQIKETVKYYRTVLNHPAEKK